MTGGRQPATPLRRWLIAWVGGALIGIGNGVARQVTFARRVDERTAHQLSALTAIAAFAGYFTLLQRRWPLSSTREAVKVGSAWSVLTVAFEFSFGLVVARQSWKSLLADYNLARGRTWPLVLAWIAVGPAVIRRLQGHCREPVSAATETRPGQRTAAS